MSSNSFFPIPSSALGGAIAVNVFAALATLALVSVVLRISWVAIRRIWSPSVGEPQEYVFFNTQLGQYAVCLILAMMFNTVAGLVGMPWLVYGGIQDGLVCRTQAILMAVGNIAGGYFTIAIAVHTFGSLVLQMRQSAIICRSTIAVGWALSVVMATAPLAIQRSEGSIYGPDGLLCDIRSIFVKEQFFLHLLPILLFSILAAILYSLIFLVLRGTLKIRGGIKLMLNPEDRWKNNQGVGENYHRFVARLARSMLWYPVAYIALLVPYSITRLFAISGFMVPFPAMVFAFVCWYLLPFVDVLLLYNTFRLLSPAFDGVSTIATNNRKSRDVESMASNVHPEKFIPTQQHNQPRSGVEQKIDLYRSRGPSPVAPHPTHDRSVSQISVASSQQSLLSRTVEFTPSHNYVVTTPPPPAALTKAGREPIRSYSPAPATPLTMPPRRVSPPSSTKLQKLAPTQQTIPYSITEELVDDHRTIPRQNSASTFGRASPRVTSWISGLNPEDPITENLTRQQLQERPRRPMVSIHPIPPSNSSYYPRSPPLSATASLSRSSSGRSPTLSPTMSISSPTQRLRPMMLRQNPPNRGDLDSMYTNSVYSTR